MAAPTRLPDHVERYMATLPSRTYSEQEHGTALQRVAIEITRRAHARYSARLAGACIGSLLLGMAIGAVLAVAL